MMVWWCLPWYEVKNHLKQIQEHSFEDLKCNLKIIFFQTGHPFLQKGEPFCGVHVEGENSMSSNPQTETADHETIYYTPSN